MIKDYINTKHIKEFNQSEKVWYRVQKPYAELIELISEETGKRKSLVMQDILEVVFEDNKMVKKLEEVLLNKNKLN